MLMHPTESANWEKIVDAHPEPIRKCASDNKCKFTSDCDWVVI